METLKPFFCYFGGKWRAAKHYPKPEYEHIIEPFAGAAGYSLRHHKLKVTLIDLDPTIVGIWKYLIKSAKDDILSLPTEVSHVDDLDICQEAKWLIGFWLNKGSATPSLTPSSWMRSGKRPNSYWGAAIRERIAQQVPEIKHWEIVEGSYSDFPNRMATWFIDPPYEGECGRLYKCKFTNYNHLAKWSQNRLGQSIVCEKEGATWLPFTPLSVIKATPGKRGKSYSKEVIWTNYTTTNNKEVTNAKKCHPRSHKQPKH